MNLWNISLVVELLSFLWNYWYLLVLVDFEDNFDGERRMEYLAGIKKSIKWELCSWNNKTIFYIFTVDKTFLQI